MRSKILNNLYRKVNNWFFPGMTLIILLLFWQLLSYLGVFETWLLPSPVMILDELINSKFFLLKHSFTTIIEIFIGLFFAIFLGVIIGILMHAYRNFEKSFLQYVIASQVFQYLLSCISVPSIPFV